MDTKQATQIKILQAVLALESGQGHLNWNYSQVAKLAGVHRTYIYYYFGKDKKDLLEAALNLTKESKV